MFHRSSPGGLLGGAVREALTAGDPAGGKMSFPMGRAYLPYMFPGAAPSVVLGLPPAGWQSRPPPSD